jgi:hypothetical protein
VFARAGLDVYSALKSMMELSGKSILLIVLQTIALLAIAILAVSTDYIEQFIIKQRRKNEGLGGFRC